MKYWRNKTLTMCVMNAILFGGSTLLALPVVQAKTADTTVTEGNDANDPYTSITVTSVDSNGKFCGVYNNSTMNLYLGGTNPTLTVTSTVPGFWIIGILNGNNSKTLTVANSSQEPLVLNVTATSGAGGTGTNKRSAEAYGIRDYTHTAKVNTPLTVTVAAQGGTTESGDAQYNASARACGAYNVSTLGRADTMSSFTAKAVGGTAGIGGSDTDANASATAYGLTQVTTVNGDLTLDVSAAGGTTLGTSASNNVSATAYGIHTVANGTTVNGSVKLTQVAAKSGTNGQSADAAAYGTYSDGKSLTITGGLTADAVTADAGTNSAANASAYGIYRTAGGTTTINGSVNLTSVKATASSTNTAAQANAYGAQNSGNLTVKGDFTANVTAAAAAGSAASSITAAGIANVGGTAEVGGNVTLAAAVNNTGRGSKMAAAIATGINFGNGSTQSSAVTYINTTDGTTSLGKTVKLTGDVMAGQSGANDIVLDGSSSWLQGNIAAIDGGMNNITIENGAVWQPVFDDRNGTFRYDSTKYTTTQDYAAALKLQNSGIIDLTWDNATRAADWRTLTIDSLSGGGGILCINADLANGNADQLSLGESSSTTNLNIDVKYDPYFTTAGLSIGSTLTGKALVVSGTGAAAVTTVTGVVDTYNLHDYVPGFTKDTDNQWYLTSYNIIDLHSAAASGAVRTAEQGRIGMSSFWFKEANSLSRRMGELRAAAPAEAGAWARWNKGEVEQGASRVDYSLGQAGYDRVLTGRHERTYRGGAVSYATGTGHYELGGGDLKESTLSFYQTGIRGNGSYYDVILKAGKFMDDVNLTQTANPSHGDYSSWAYSVSGEYGRRFSLGGGSYVEPQAELLLGRLQGADYTTSTGLQVNLGAQNKALTRLGAALGRDFAGGSLYFKASWYHDFGSGISLTGRDGTLSRSYSQDIARDWAELVLGGTVRAGKNCTIYGELSKYLGDLKSNLQFNLGARWNF